MLTEAAVSLTNIQRWAHERVAEDALEALQARGQASIVPASLRRSAKTTQYETEVVENFLQVSAQSFAYHGSEALWERPIRTGSRGRPTSIDVSLFNAARSEEARVEFGFYTKAKLRQDAGKLWAIKTEAKDDIPETTIANFVILWSIHKERASVVNADKWLSRCITDACDTAPAGANTIVRAASLQDLFSPTGGGGNSLRAAIFEVIDSAS